MNNTPRSCSECIYYDYDRSNGMIDCKNDNASIDREGNCRCFKEKLTKKEYKATIN